jgi:hypothetical protein
MIVSLASGENRLGFHQGVEWSPEVAVNFTGCRITTDGKVKLKKGTLHFLEGPHTPGWEIRKTDLRHWQEVASPLRATYDGSSPAAAPSTGLWWRDWRKGDGRVYQILVGRRIVKVSPLPQRLGGNVWPLIYRLAFETKAGVHEPTPTPIPDVEGLVLLPSPWGDRTLFFANGARGEGVEEPWAVYRPLVVMCGEEAQGPMLPPWLRAWWNLESPYARP